jgi:hypothetical protein
MKYTVDYHVLMTFSVCTVITIRIHFLFLDGYVIYRALYYFKVHYREGFEYESRPRDRNPVAIS